MKGFIVQVGDVDVLQTYPPPREGVRVAGQGRVLLSLSGTPLNIPDLLSSAEIPGPESCTGPPPPPGHREKEEEQDEESLWKALWPCVVMFCFFLCPCSLVSTLYLNYLSFL